MFFLNEFWAHAIDVRNPPCCSASLCIAFICMLYHTSALLLPRSTWQCFTVLLLYFTVIHNFNANKSPGHFHTDLKDKPSITSNDLKIIMIHCGERITVTESQRLVNKFHMLLKHHILDRENPKTKQTAFPVSSEYRWQAWPLHDPQPQDTWWSSVHPWAWSFFHLSREFWPACDTSTPQTPLQST